MLVFHTPALFAPLTPRKMEALLLAGAGTGDAIAREALERVEEDQELQVPAPFASPFLFRQNNADYMKNKLAVCQGGNHEPSGGDVELPEGDAGKHWRAKASEGGLIMVKIK